MTVGYSTSLKSARMQTVIAAIDDGAGVGVLELYTAGYATLLVSINLVKPSFTESNGVITMAGAPRSGIAGGSGAAALARVRDSNSNYEISGLTVGVATGDIRLNSTAIEAGQTITITAGTITHP